MFTAITNKRLCSAITISDALHGFRQGQGGRTSNLESKMVHQFMGICHEPQFQVILDVRKVYNSLDWKRYMRVIKGYGIGPKTKVTTTTVFVRTDGDTKNGMVIRPSIKYR